MNEPMPPSPLRLTLKIPVMVRCSAADCIAAVDVDGLPLAMPDVGAPPIIDRGELAASLPSGWRVGAMRPLGVGLILDGGPPPDARPMPVCFCPEHAPKERR